MSAPGAAARRRWKGGRELSTGHVIYWWVELLAILAFYLVYSYVRNTNKSGQIEAFRNARQIMSLQRSLGINHEELLQDWAQHAKPLIIAANYFYGSLHFVVTIAAGVFLFRWFSDDYPFMRNTIGIATALALVGFIGYPLMPPRLLPDSYGFVDTLARYPTFWSFNSGAMSKVSNQFAAMPSVHVCWSTWCALVFVPRVKPLWGKVLAVCYPLATVTVIVITANHYVLDAVGGLAILGIAWFFSSKITRAGRIPVSQVTIAAARPT